MTLLWTTAFVAVPIQSFDRVVVFGLANMKHLFAAAETLTTVIQIKWTARLLANQYYSPGRPFSVCAQSSD